MSMYFFFLLDKEMCSKIAQSLSFHRNQSVKFLPGWLSGPVTANISASILSSSGKGLEDTDIIFNSQIKNFSLKFKELLKISYRSNYVEN